MYVRSQNGTSEYFLVYDTKSRIFERWTWVFHIWFPNCQSCWVVKQADRGRYGRWDSSCWKMWWVSGHQHRGWEGFLGIALVLESLISTLECGFGTNRMSAFWTPFVGCPFFSTCWFMIRLTWAKTKPLDIGKQKVRFRCVFSKWLVPITFGFLTIRVSSVLISGWFFEAFACLASCENSPKYISPYLTHHLNPSHMLGQLLGIIIHKKYGEDLYIIDKFPKAGCFCLT